MRSEEDGMEFERRSENVADGVVSGLSDNPRDRAPCAGADARGARSDEVAVAVALAALAALGLVLTYAVSHWIVHGWLLDGLHAGTLVRVEADASRAPRRA